MTLIPRPRGGRRYLARIRKAKGVDAHLGLYESAGLAAFAFNVAWEALGRGSRPPNEIARDQQPDAETVRTISRRVRRRLGLEPAEAGGDPMPVDPEQLLVLFEVVVVGFWRREAEATDADLDATGRRLAESARLLFADRPKGSPTPASALARLLGLRLDRAFRRADLARAILDDDEDDEWRVARWLVLPDSRPGGRGFRDEVRALYPDLFDDEPDAPLGVPHWAAVLGLDPPFSTDRVREAYRTRARSAHPDAGGSHAAFLRLQAAHDEAREYCRILGI